ncbi:MAG: SPOR domain-containing protein [Bacteroidota bacterium]
MKIGKYISDLLFENDFVILPDVGEFSTKYIPAKFIPELKKVESPSKVITFNERNKTGGGLLIEYIAKKEDISSIQSREFVEKFVSEMKNSLQAGKKVELEKVGSFSRDEHGLLVFEPDTSINYLSDSIGMTPVKEPAKKSEEEAKSELDKVIEEVSTGDEKPDDKKKGTDKEPDAVPDDEKEDLKQKEDQVEKEDRKADIAPVKSDSEFMQMQDKTEEGKEEEPKETYTKVTGETKIEEKKTEEEKTSADEEKQPEKEEKTEEQKKEPKKDFGIKSHQPVIKTVSSADPQTKRPGAVKPQPMNFPKAGSREASGFSSGKTDNNRKKFEQKPKEGGLPPALKWVAFTVVPLLIIIVVLALNYDYIFGDKSVVFNGDDDAVTMQQSEDFEDEQMTDETSPAVDQRETDQSEVLQDAPATPQQGRMVYYVIVGSFEEEHSAIILEEELRSAGAANARVFPVNPQGFYRVAYGFYYDLDEAERVLQDAKQISENAWILHRQN